MSTRPVLVTLLAAALLSWALVTRGAFEDHSRRSLRAGPSAAAPPPTLSTPLSAAPTEVVRLSLEEWPADHCGAVPQPDTETSLLLLQAGDRLLSLDLRSGSARVAAEMRLPDDAYVWDLLAGDSNEDTVLSLGSGAVRRSQRTPLRDAEAIAAPGTLFRGRPSRAPLCRSFALRCNGALDFVVPGLDELAWMRMQAPGQAARPLCRVATHTLAQQSLGYGLADTMSCRLSVPFFQLGAGPDGASLLLQRDDRLLRCKEDGTEQDLGRAPVGGDREILGFDHAIPPLSVDWDGDGSLDVLFTVPGDGTILAYGSSRRDSMPRDAQGDRGPDQALRVSGWILWRWLLDADGDGRLDLLLLEVPKLNMLGQVAVLRSGRMQGNLSLRPQRADAQFDPTPQWSESFILPVAISLRRKERRIDFPSPVAPLLDPRDGLLLLIPDGEDLLVGRAQAHGLEVLHRFPGLADGHVVDRPFTPLFAQLDGVGGHDLAWVERSTSPARARLIVHRFP